MATVGSLTIQAAGDVNLNTAVPARPRRRASPTGGFGNGGTLGIRSFNGTLSWTNGQGDVSPTGNFTGPPPRPHFRRRTEA